MLWTNCLSRRGLGGRRNVQMNLQIDQAQAGGAGGLDTGGVDTVSEVGTQHSVRGSGIISSINMLLSPFLCVL